jgi:MFS family permease
MKTTQHETTETPFDPKESLALISSMINTAKHKLADDGFLFIFWGWLVSICALGHFTAIKLHLPYGEFVWAIGMPLGGIFSGIYGYRRRKQQRVRTYIDTYLAYVWGAFIIALFIALGFMPLHGIKTTYFFLMVLYGIATFISGGLIGFRPLIFGSLVAFGCAIASTFFGNVEQLLWIALSLIGSYVVPGHLLRAKYKSQVHAERA